MGRQTMNGLPLRVILSITLFIMLSRTALAQTRPIEWKVQIVREEIGILYDGVQLVLDDQGQAHIFYSGGENLSLVDAWDRYLIYYYSPDRPEHGSRDIIMAPATDTSRPGVILFDADYDFAKDRITVLWAYERQLFFSTVATQKATDPHAWSTSKITSDALVASSAIDSAGGIHIVYGTLSEGKLEYVASINGGAQWTAPVVLYSLDTSSPIAFSRMKIIVDPGGRFYLTWSEAWPAGEKSIWGPHAVRYSRFRPEIGTLENPETVMEISPTTVDYLNVNLGPNGELIRTWSRGAGSTPGRYEQWSSDGITWSAPAPILLPESGLGGYNHVFWDSQGQAYQISTGQDNETLRIALRVYALTGNGWLKQATPQSCEFADVEVFRGNRVDVVCRTNGGVAFLRGTMDAEPLPEPTPPPVRLTPIPIASPTGNLAAAQSVPMPAIASSRAPLDGMSGGRPAAPMNNLLALILGGLAALTVIAVAFARQLQRSLRRR